MFSREERVDIFISRFHGRSDVFARRWEKWDGSVSGYAPVYADSKKEAYAAFTNEWAEKHLIGSQTLGVYPLLRGNVSHFIAADFYVYYGCCRFRDKDCKSGYMREEELIEQLASLMDTIDLNEIGIRERIKSEIERHKKFQSGVLGIKEKAIKVSHVDVRNYAKYLLREGTIFEKRELLSCLRSKLLMANKKITVSA